MEKLDSSMIAVAPLDELRERGVMVVRGDVPIAVYSHEGAVRAVDNRCPHMGFPLHKGTVKDGILTCHWHQARFDLCSGCAFDLWADDVLPYDTEVRDNVVYVSRKPRVEPGREYHERRFIQGIEQNISLIQAKSILGLRDCGELVAEIVRRAALFGSHHHESWGSGMTRLAIALNLAPFLSPRTAYFALAVAAGELADECDGAPERRERAPLGEGHDAGQLKRWLLHWTRSRHRDAAERTVLTAIQQSTAPADFADMLFAAASERPMADGGHLFDFCNKMLELNEHLDALPELAPLLVRSMVNARGGEESAHWRHPVDLITPLHSIEAQLPDLLAAPRNENWTASESLRSVLLGDDPHAIIDGLSNALREGAPAHHLSRLVAYAAAMRLARFAITNDVGDWFGPQHTFVYANAVHQAIGRNASPNIVRAIFHGAMAVYLDRFLNVPPARLPGERDSLDDLPSGARELLDLFLATLDQRSQIDASARVAVRYMRLGHSWNDLVDTLVFAAVREDIDFHPLQVIEAGVRQCEEWKGRPEAEHIVTGMVRSLAAVCPTRRGSLQTATIAMRLHGRERVYEEE